MKNIFEEEIEMKNKNYALSPTAENPATPHKKEGKFRLFIMKIGKRNIIITASVLLSCALSVLFTLTGGLAAMPLPGLVLYQLIWCAVSLAFSVFQRY